MIGIDRDVMRRITNWIDMSTGNFLIPCQKNDAFRHDWFTFSGEMREDIYKALGHILVEKKYEWMADCDVPKVLGAARFARNINHVFPCIYYWLHDD